MLYLLLIIPHLVAAAGLLGYALRSGPIAATEDSSDESYGSEGEPKPPPNQPRQGPAVDGPPLPDAAPAGRRLRDAERLADLRPRRRRGGSGDTRVRGQPELTASISRDNRTADGVAARTGLLRAGVFSAALGGL